MALRFVILSTLFVAGAVIGFCCYSVIGDSGHELPIILKVPDDPVEASQVIVIKTTNKNIAGWAYKVSMPVYKEGTLVEDRTAEVAVWMSGGPVYLTKPVVFRYKEGEKRWYLAAVVKGDRGRIDTEVLPGETERAVSGFKLQGNTKMRTFRDPDTQAEKNGTDRSPFNFE